MYIRLRHSHKTNNNNNYNNYSNNNTLYIALQEITTSEKKTSITRERLAVVVHHDHCFFPFTYEYCSNDFMTS